jgi:hypothetical protein
MTETVSRSESADGHAHSLLVEHQPLILAECLCDHQRREEGGHQKGDDPGNARGKLASPTTIGPKALIAGFPCGMWRARRRSS